MRKIYRTAGKRKLERISATEDGAWISLVAPTDAELTFVAQRYAIELDDLRAALDLEERSRISVEDGYVLILVDVPTTELRDDRSSYITIPLGIVIAADVIITVCSELVSVLADFESGRVSDINTAYRTQFTLQLLLRTATSYLEALREIDKLIDQGEAALRRSSRNTELMAMLDLEKSLLYINTSLLSNQRVLNRIMRTPSIKKYPEDDELLHDIVIEYEQAIEVSGIYSSILTGMMDAYASVIGNNQNLIMKTLAVATIVMSIPTMVFSAYGMNLNFDGMPGTAPVWGFAVIVLGAFAAAAIAMVYLFHRKWF